MKECNSTDKFKTSSLRNPQGSVSLSDLLGGGIARKPTGQSALPPLKAFPYLRKKGLPGNRKAVRNQSKLYIPGM